jgi:hypothetical protein
MAQEPILPTSLQNFEELRQKGAIYVDKTMFFPLLEQNKIIFCARPRRFGKTLTIHTLDAYHSGKNELFKGLEAEKYMASPDFMTHPVIRMDMSAMADTGSLVNFQDNLMDCLEICAERHNVSLRKKDTGAAFRELLTKVHNLYGNKVALLIDEYDSPVLSLVQRDENTYDEIFLSQTRVVMRNFYTQIKIADEHIHSVFITGVTKFSKMGVFSQLNTLFDISLLPHFGSFMGYTQRELEENFDFHINKISKKFQITRNDLLNKIRNYYDGFSFNGITRLYNPLSVLSLFASGQFINYWMESGSNSLIRQFLRDKGLTADQFPGMEVDMNFAANPGEIDATPPEGFLYQSGYLTLRHKHKIDNFFTLDYPNLEVRSSISSLFLENLNPSWATIRKSRLKLIEHLKTCNVTGIVQVYWKLLAGICFQDQSTANRGPKAKKLDSEIRKATGGKLPETAVHKLTETFAERIRKEKGESFYRSILQASLWMAGATVNPEKDENRGSLDLEATFGDLTYVFELKMATNARGGEKAARSGILQAHDTGYGLASDNPILVSIAIGRQEKNVVSFFSERDGKDMGSLAMVPWNNPNANLK